MSARVGLDSNTTMSSSCVKLENGPTVKISPPKDWREGKSLQERNLHMFHNQIECDVVFEVKHRRRDTPERILAHSFVLIAASPTFMEILTRDTTNRLRIIVSDVRTESFRMMLEYIYSDRIKLTLKNVADVLKVANKYKVFGLIGGCLKFMLHNIDDDSVCFVLQQAYKYDCKTLMDKCLALIDKDASDILKSDKILSLNRECLDKIISRDSLIVTEAEVYEAVLKWARHDCKMKGLPPNSVNIRLSLGNSFFHIRFPLLSPQYFTDNVATRDILNDAEKVDLFRYFYSSPKPKLVFSDMPRQWNKRASGIICIRPHPDIFTQGLTGSHMF